MSSVAAQHPDDGLLLRYIDGELTARKTRLVARHLEACWQCRTEVEDLEGTVAECVRYRRNVLAVHLPPPGAWKDLAPEFERIDASWRREPWFARLLGVVRGPAFRPWAIAATALALVCGLYWKFQQAPAVEAAALLQRAVAAGQLRPAGVRRIEVRTRSRKFTRTVGVAGKAAATDAAAVALEVRLTAAHYDWEDPLSARTFALWRNGLPSKQDEVTTLANAYRVETTSPEGDLSSASLTLRDTDLRPLEARIEFRDREWIEFSEITDAPARDDAPPVIAPTGRPERRAEPSRPAATSSGTVPVSEELQVLAALHEIGADLGDPVEVTVADGKVRVGGVGLEAERRALIQQRLSGMPDVVVAFSEPAASLPAEAAPAAVASGVPAGANPTAWQLRLEQQVGGHADLARFSAYVLERNDALMARAYSLRGLAQRFPASAESGLTEADRRVLREMAREHAAALNRELSTIEKLLPPVLVSMGASAVARVTPQAEDWQSGAEELFRASRRAEVLLSRFLGVSSADGSTDRLAPDLLAALGEQRNDLDSLRKVLP